MAVDAPDCAGKIALYWTANAGTQESVNEDQRIAKTAIPGHCGVNGRPGTRYLSPKALNFHGSLESGEIFRSVALYLFWVSEEQDTNFDAHLLEVPRDDEAVAAVVSLSAEDDDAAALEMREAVANEFGDAAASVFHQGKTGDAVALRGEPVDLPHFRRGENIHAKEIPRNGTERYRSSRHRSPGTCWGGDAGQVKLHKEIESQTALL